jgi:heme/copper-type cytochrome/quinol oxidase subunit 1
MSAIPHPIGAPSHGDTASHSHGHEAAHAHEHHEIGFMKKYFFSIDHKMIGLQFLFVGLAFFVIGGLLAMLVRWQLGFGGHAVPIIGKYMSTRGWNNGVMPSDFYTMAFSMHASIMIFFVIIPLLVGTFGNYLIPLKIGAGDMAFPFLNGMAFWSALPSGTIMLASFFLQGGAAAAGWTVYPPLSAIDQTDHAMGRVTYQRPDGAFGRLLGRLRIHDIGATLVGKFETNTGKTEYTQTYTGDAARVLEGAKAAVVAPWAITASTSNSVSVKTDKGTPLTLTLTDRDGSSGVASIASPDPASQLGARVFLGRIDKKLREEKHASGWQSTWSTPALLINFGALFMSFMFIAAYFIRLGSRAINVPVSIFICLIAAYFTLHGVQRAAFDGQSAWFLSIIILGFSSIMGAVNYLTTIVKLRCPGMTMFRMPLSVWSLFITSVLVLLATPVLASVLTMNLLDHHGITSFFEPFNWINSNQLQDRAGGGYALLHQHLFWFYSHPAVYIMILPAMGMVSDIMAVFARKPIFGYRPMVYAMAGIAFLGFIVWAHHMFQSGMNPTLGTTFAISTMFIAVPSAIKTFNWLGTLWGGNIRFTTPMLNAIAFVSMFVIGGLSGIFMASTAVDVHIHDTYFIVAHIHYVLFGGTMFGVFGSLYFWYPKMFGRMMNERLGKVHFWLTFITFNGTFFAMHILGIGGMPRRVYDPHAYEVFRHFLPMNRFISINAFGLGLAQILFVINFIGSWVWGPKAGNNPWEATTLEWNDTTSPPPHGNFTTVPVVYHGPYEYSSPLVEEDWLPQTRYVEGSENMGHLGH